MLIYNTTYSVEKRDLTCFLAWVTEHLIPTIHADGTLSEGRLARILGHDSEGDGYCYSLQFTVTDSAELHRWFVRQGKELQTEMNRIFDRRVIGFSTLMEVVE